METEALNVSRRRRPGYLTQYAAHAGITKTAAAEQLKRVGINYLEPFDFADADRRRHAMRHADRAPFAKPIYDEGSLGAASSDEGTGAGDGQGNKHPIFSESQARRELYRAKMAQLEYEEKCGQLIRADEVEQAAFRMSRQVRDAILSIPARLAGILAAESEQRRIHELLEQELRQALEALAGPENETPPALAIQTGVSQ